MRIVKRNKELKKLWMLLLGIVMLFAFNQVSVLADGISDGIQKVVNVYPNSYSYFTENAQSDSSNKNSNCSLVNIPSRGGLPSGKVVKAACGDAWSCHAFAQYVWYVVFGHGINAQTREIQPSELKYGDFIRFNGHSAIYLGEDSTYYYVYDSNWALPADNKVRYNHGIKKTARAIDKCYHATNYDEVAKSAPSKPSDPQGCLDTISGGEGNVFVSGWALDYDDLSKNLEIHVYIGNPYDQNSSSDGHVIIANKERKDVNASMGASGNHGFEEVIPTTKRGTQQLYIYAINVGNGANVLLGTPTVTIKQDNPIGCIDGVSGGKNTITVSGWAYDPNVSGESIDVHVYVGGDAASGAKVYGLTANQERADVNAIDGITGKHGFSKTIAVDVTGDQPVYVYAINKGAGGNTYLGMKKVHITDASPKGYVERADGGKGIISLGGWAYDPKKPSESLTIHMYVGGPAGSGAKCYPLSTIHERADVNKSQGITGKHGYSQEIKVTERGKQKVYVYAINAGMGPNTLLGTKDVEIISTYNTTGVLDSISGGKGTITVSGWAYDRDEVDTPIMVHMYIGGPAGTKGAELKAFKADKERKDVGKIDKVGNYHGYSQCVEVSKRGKQKVYLYAINLENRADNTMIGSAEVTISDKEYTVSYDANGGSNAPASQVKKEKQSLQLSTAIPKKSYTVRFDANGGNVDTTTKTLSSEFTGWNTNAAGKGTAYAKGASYNTDANLKLYAQWKDKTLGTLPVASRTGYIFQGWFTQKDGGVKVADTTGITGNITLYAHYGEEDNSLTLTTQVKVQGEAVLPYGRKLSTLKLDTEYAKFVNADGKTVDGSLEWENQDIILKPGENTVGWIFNPQNTRYKKVTGTLTVTVEAAEVTIKEFPQAEQYVYAPDRKLSSIGLKGGKVTAWIDSGETEIAGHWEFRTQDMILDVGEHVTEVMFVPDKPSYYKNVVTEISVIVTQAIPEIVTLPQTKEIIYGDSLVEAKLVGGRCELPDGSEVKGSFSWVEENIYPAVSDSNKTEYQICFVPENHKNYSDVLGKLKVTVQQAQNAPGMPENERKVGFNISKLGQIDLPSGWSWKSSGETLLPAGKSVVQEAVFRDTENYKNYSVNITILREECTHTGGVATCTKRAVCSICGEAYGEIDSRAHLKLKYSDSKEATCVEDGYTPTLSCEECGTVLMQGTKLPAKGHEWDEGKVAKEPTQSEEGQKIYTCKVCKETKSETIPKLEACKHQGGNATCIKKAVCQLCGEEYGEINVENHVNTVQSGAVEPSCTTPGKTAETICRDCGTVLVQAQTLPAKGHEWDEGKVAKEPTQSEEGQKIYTCKVCKETKSETIPKIEACKHQGGNATCIKRAICSICGEAYGETNENNHVHTSLANAIEATCTANGRTADTVCEDCGRIITKGQTILAAGHTWDAGVVTSQPTENAEGQKVYTCQKCREIRSEVLPKLPKAETTTDPIKPLKKNQKFVYKNVIYKVSKTGNNPEATVVGMKAKKSSVVILDTVNANNVNYRITGIANNAFAKNAILSTVKIGRNVTTIGKNAFRDCKKLKKITIQSSKLKKVGSSAIRDIHKKATFIVPKSKLKAYKKLFTGKTGFTDTMKIRK